MSDRLRVLILAPYLNRAGLGEVYSIFKWVEAMGDKFDITVLTVAKNDHLKDQLPNAKVVWMREPGLLSKMSRFNAQAKPWLPVFFAWTRRWIRNEIANGTRWDIVHQILPQAMRYASPLPGLGLPFVVGPLGGSLETPPGFRSEVNDGGIANRLRRLDRWRLRHDRKLRRGFEDADLILGVAPYVGETLRGAGLRLRRFEAMLERSHEGVFPEVSRTSGPGEAHLLHVGRGIRTKGLRDVVRAVAQLRDLPRVRLTSAGDGPEIDASRAEAKKLGVSDRITFLGRIPRSEVDQLYAEADIFCFPSFREPMGGVFFEAMEWGLPIIAAARGGPDFILDDNCSIRLAVETPEQFANDIAGAIRKLATKPDLRRSMGASSVARLKDAGGWDAKAKRLEVLYSEIISGQTPAHPLSG